ncbi:putative RNA helicase/RNAse III [Aspergillus mulundensis]|uniref:Dicer-like protein 2 n=1 Tax=Aspergillus mulundensis TaxID=1810919 RepID=A0A3D8SKR5_9EURO|nr:Dicer-like protein 2 [Aspergillus mulundensis]RDW86925.1 Dicer-like protein 2 [Aspergillus mulundensis]
MASTPEGEPADHRARNYQLEMFEASLKGNIIVAMGTGSGKTQIAILRIMHELENSDGKLIWFLAPTVALCLQQHRVISQHIPAAKSRTLLGLDKVELWTEQAIWDAVLEDIQVVVSTPAVLLDALTHGFVRMSRLGLIIFDEAHHCTNKHPANMIMKNFYHPSLRNYGSKAVPRILGLTASAASSRGELQTIEANLGSICTTPQEHRQELLEHTYRPELRRVLYTPLVIEDASAWGGTQKALTEAYNMLNLEDDPYVRKLRRTFPNGSALQKVLSTGNTYCSDQMKKFVSRAVHIFTELGEWAAEYFIWASIEQLRGRTHNGLVMDLDDDELKYLVNTLSRLPVPSFDVQSTDPADFPVSPKFEALVSFLLSTNEQNFSGLIFVQQRAVVAVMSHLLSVHPSTRDRFRTGGFIGMSNSTKRKDMLGDLLSVKMQRDTLDDFRHGRKNLIISTDVLEEGIDVSACSVVVCYDKPPSLKSFVQRRGRARRQHSTYSIVLSTEDDESSLHKWQNVEKAMEDAYQEDRSRVEELRALEDLDEDVCACFCVDPTGALLTAENAMQHLFHFCATLPGQKYVDNRPEFFFERHDGGDLRATVTLPSSVNPKVRRAEGKSWWKTERAAKKEAAFHAYKALYEHGLLNDNLLPLTKSREFSRKGLGSSPSLQDVSAQYDPWADWACLWKSPKVHQSRIIIRQNGDVAHMRLITPTELPILEPMTLFWDNETTYVVEIEAAEPILMTAEDIERMRTVTETYLHATTSKPPVGKNDYIALFGPDLAPDSLPAWLDKNHGHEPASEVFSSQRHPNHMGVVRDKSRFGEVLIFKRWLNRNDGLELACDSYPSKRRNLLQKQTLAQKRPADDDLLESPTKKRIISAKYCTIDRLPATETVFGRFIAVILDRLEAALVATKLCQTVLRDIHFHDLRHVVTAITMPLAQAPTDYQRYEFFGDSVLKFTVATSLFYNHTNWHEGYLTEKLSALVQNARLTRAALECGLDAYIISNRFTPGRWTAPLISEKLSTAAPRRQMGAKVLADVVEALIGAAYIDGGLRKAQTCIRRFLQEFTLASPSVPIPEDQDNRPRLIQQKSLEDRIGYTFNNSALLIEALTHPSCQYDASTQSYQRLEFLGDAVLDMLIVDLIRVHGTEMSQGEMTKIKHAIVSGQLLSFLCMEFEWTWESTSSPTIDIAKKLDIELTTPPPKTVSLYTYVRHSPATPLPIHAEPEAYSSPNAITRHKLLRAQILHALNNKRSYPWSHFSAIHADKFFSDIVESIIGAIFVDSGGDLTACAGFIERLGLVSIAKRILDERVDVTHPMQRVQMMLQKATSRFDNNEAFRFDYKTARVSSSGKHKILQEDDDDQNGDADTDETGDGEPMHTYTCTISLASLRTAQPLGQQLNDIVVTGCLSKEDAEIRAAEATIELIRRFENAEFHEGAKDGDWDMDTGVPMDLKPDLDLALGAAVPPEAESVKVHC